MLVIIGHITYDEIINRDGERRVIPGGAGYTGAMGGSFVHKNVGLVSRIGGDYDMANLAKLGINLEGVQQIPDGLTTRFILEYKYHDPLQRDFTGDFNVGSDINPSDIPPAYVEQATHVHIATMPPQQQELFIEYLRAVRPDLRISIDTIEQFVDAFPEEVLRNFYRSDLLFLDRRELTKLPSDLLEGRAAVIKRGAEGAVYLEGERIIAVPTKQIERVIDKTGSGDLLAGVFLASREMGVGIEGSLKRGCEIATSSIEQFGVEHLFERQRQGTIEHRY